MACYVLDNNGYIVISKDKEHTGRFFGEIDGTIMDSLVYYEVYQRIRVYDYQAVCLDHTGNKNAGNFLLTVRIACVGAEQLQPTNSNCYSNCSKKLAV